MTTKKLTSQKGIFPIIAIIVLAVIFIGGGAYYFKQNQNIVQKIKTTVSQEITQDSWYDYANHQLGFSLRLPRYVVGFDGCNHRKFMVPLTVIEDNKNNQVRILPEYYYDTSYDKTGHQIDGTCKKEVYSLASDQTGMLIRVENVRNDEELVAFIKKTSGSGCGLLAKHESKNRGYGIYDVEIDHSKQTIYGEGPGNNNCNTGGPILYSEGKQAMYSPSRQEAAFSGSYDNSVVYDFWILDEFSFEK